MKLFTRTEWELVWSATDIKGLPLQEYAKLCNEENAKRYKLYPGVDFSNARYACHIERHLEAGTTIPGEILASVTKDDIQFDWFCFPNLAPLLGFPNPRKEAA